MSSVSSLVRTKFGMVGCADSSQTRSAISVMPGVAATAEKRGAMGSGERALPRPTAWHWAQTRTASLAPLPASPGDCAAAGETRAMTAAAARAARAKAGRGIEVSFSSRDELELNPAPHRVGVALQSLQVRRVAAALEAGDDRLGGSHLARDIGLRQAGLRARRDERERQREFRLEAVVLGAEGRVLHPFVFELLERDRHRSNPVTHTWRRTIAIIRYWQVAADIRRGARETGQADKPHEAERPAFRPMMYATMSSTIECIHI